jgi:peptidoglycan/LPS O-acetylase OafA/YrhL
MPYFCQPPFSLLGLMVKERRSDDEHPRRFSSQYQSRCAASHCDFYGAWPALRLLSLLDQGGTGWCQSFFVLSGFLVSGLLFISYQERGRIELSRFYIRRGLKIWPAFYTLIAAGLLVDLVRGRPISGAALLSELAFMQSYFKGIWEITWSLAVEEHFYLSLPLLLLLLIYFNSERPFANILHIFIAIAILALACRFAVGWKENASTDPLTYLYPTHLRIDGLMFGVLLSYYSRFRPNLFERFASWQGGWVLIAIAIALLSIFPVENRNMHPWGLTVIYVAAGCLVAKAVAFEGPRPIRVISGFLAPIGVYSYSIYLWHIFYKHMLGHFFSPTHHGRGGFGATSPAPSCLGSPLHRRSKFRCFGSGTGCFLAIRIIF